MNASDKVAVGQRYGRLVVIGLIEDRKNPKAHCVCDCGKEVTPQRGSLRNGRAKSCGCLGKEHRLAATKTHGQTRTSLYRRWQLMKRRCFDPTDKSYKNYGGRGITVAREWLDFEAFLRDMGHPPKGATLERKDTNGNYCKENCVWSGWDQQSTNRRDSKRWFINGLEFVSSVAAAAHFKVSPSVITRRTNGYWRHGKWHPPVPGYSSKAVYGGDDGLSK